MPPFSSSVPPFETSPQSGPSSVEWCFFRSWPGPLCACTVLPCTDLLLGNSHGIIEKHAFETALMASAIFFFSPRVRGGVGYERISSDACTCNLLREINRFSWTSFWVRTETLVMFCRVTCSWRTQYLGTHALANVALQFSKLFLANKCLSTSALATLRCAIN